MFNDNGLILNCKKYSLTQKNCNYLFIQVSILAVFVLLHYYCENETVISFVSQILYTTFVIKLKFSRYFC